MCGVRPAKGAFGDRRRRFGGRTSPTKAASRYRLPPHSTQLLLLSQFWATADWAFPFVGTIIPDDSLNLTRMPVGVHWVVTGIGSRGIAALIPGLWSRPPSGAWPTGPTGREMSTRESRVHDRHPPNRPNGSEEHSPGMREPKATDSPGQRHTTITRTPKRVREAHRNRGYSIHPGSLFMCA